MRKIALFAFVILIAYSCGSGGNRGELTGVKSKRKWFAERPLGMILIPEGSFTMGKQDADVMGTLGAPPKTVTVKPFYMDDTEVTNSEYKQFVFWVRDSIIRTKLAEEAEGSGGSSEEEGGGSKRRGSGISSYAYADADTTKSTPYQKYMIENYQDSLRPLNWEVDLIWDEKDFPDESYVMVMDSMYIKKEDAVGGVRTINTDLLRYRYSWIDITAAAKQGGARKDFLKQEVLKVYPDTAVWVKDFSYSYNDPMHQDYFSHDAYSQYPVVGVNWYQAKAFCQWRTKFKNDYLRSKNKSRVSAFRLPTEAEWEYAARGGLDFAKYPWGGPDTRNDRGCFLANFKPTRGDYATDGGLYTMEAKSFMPNDYGLYNMAGNVSEWTNTAYNLASYYMGSTMNPNVEDRENKRKIIRGGSWKDVAFFLEVGSRDYEYADSARSYIGFRTVQDYLGVKK